MVHDWRSSPIKYRHDGEAHGDIGLICLTDCLVGVLTEAYVAWQNSLETREQSDS